MQHDLSKDPPAQEQSSTPSPSARTPGKGPLSEELSTSGPNEPPVSQPGPAAHAPAWEADEETLDAFGMSSGDVTKRGYQCEREGGDNCFLTERGRDQYRTDLTGFAGSAMQNFQAAIARVRLDKMLEKSGDSWGAISEILFYSLTGPLIGAAVKGFKTAKAAAQAAKTAKEVAELGYGAAEKMTLFQQAIMKVSEEDVSAGLQNVSRGIRKELQNAGQEDRSSKAWDTFLKIIEAGIKPLTDSIIADAPASLDDASYVVFVQGYRDPEAHSPDSYEAYLTSLLARFEGQQLDQINDRFKDGGKTRTVVLSAYGQTCTAILADHGTKYLGTFGVGVDREKVYGSGEKVLISIVDDDLAPYAQKIYTGVTNTIEVTENSWPFTFPYDDDIVQFNNVEARFKKWVAAAKALESMNDLNLGVL